MKLTITIELEEQPACQHASVPAGTAEQGSGQTSPNAAPCSAENPQNSPPGGSGHDGVEPAGNEGGAHAPGNKSADSALKAGCDDHQDAATRSTTSVQTIRDTCESGVTSPGEQRAPDSRGEGAWSEAQPLARAGSGEGRTSPDDLTSQTAHPPQPGHCPTCRIVVSDFIGGTPAQCPDCGGPIQQDAPRPLNGGEPSLEAAATGEASPAGTGPRTPSRHEGPHPEGPGTDGGPAGTPARPDSYPDLPPILDRSLSEEERDAAWAERQAAE